ncbi:MAG: LapA family protein [Gemmatimonadales bacterium]|nr:MAG: LapA family protein [Gemmatimonadales bacterium]
MDVKKLWQGTKQILAAILGGLIVLFAFVNLKAVPVNLLFTQVEVSLSLLVLISAFGGVSIGWMGGALRGRRKRKALKAGHRAELRASTEAEDEDWLAEGLEEEVAVPLE